MRRPDRLDRLTNRYVAWLEHGAPPPIRGSLGKAEEAASRFAAQARRARTRLERTGASWPTLDALLVASQHLQALFSLVEGQASVSKRMAPAASESWVQKWRKWHNRFCFDLSSRRAGAVLREMAETTRSPIRQRQLALLFRRGECHLRLDFLLRREAHAQQCRENAYVRNRETRGGIVLQSRVDGLHRDYFKAAKTAALKRGMDGYLFLMGTDESYAAAQNADHEGMRRLLWSEDAYSPTPTLAVERTRRRRQELAQAFGFSSYAEYKLSNDYLINDPAVIVRAIHKAREAIRADVRAYRNATTELARAEGLDVGDADAPWNQLFVSNNATNAVFVDYSKIFPWRETALKVFSDVCRACGWTAASAARVSGDGIWSAIRLHLQDEDGHQVHLIYTPFRPHQKGHSYSAGEASSIINRWCPDQPGTRATVVWINQTLDAETQAFGLDDLRVLCHEIGHALHFSAARGAGPDEHDYMCDDLMEIPSYLLELYMRDPVVLARWASRRGPAAARRSRFWMRKLEWDWEAALEHQASLRSAEVDLLVHSRPEQSFQDISRRCLAEDGERMWAEDGRWRRNFIWETHVASLDYTQSLSHSIVRRLVTVPDTGRTNSSLVAAAYNALLSEVLVPGMQPSTAARRWRQWTGESFRTTLRESLISHARQSARITRRATTKVRAKTTRVKLRGPRC